MKKSAVVVALVALGCASEKAGPEPEPTRRVVVATFTGEIDRVAGTFSIRTEPTAAGRALGMKSLNVDANVFVANGGTTWNNAEGHCTATGQSSGGTVTVTNIAIARLDNVWAVIDTMTPATGMESCNSDTTPDPLGMTTNLGVWYYGDLLAGDTSTAKPWAFKWTGASARNYFSGHIEAATVGIRANAAPNVVVATPSSTVMTGTANRAIFLDGTGQKVSLVNSSGVLVQTGALSAPPSGVAVNAAGTEAWVTMYPSIKIARVLIPSGQVNEFPYVGARYIAIDPVDGLVWTNDGVSPAVSFMNLVDDQIGSVQLPVGATPGPMVAVNRNGTCLLYVEDSARGDIYPVNCTTKALAEPMTINLECSHSSGMHLIAGPEGTAWYVGPLWFSGAGAWACGIQDSYGFGRFPIYFGATEAVGEFVYGPDGNFWATITPRYTTPRIILDFVRLWATQGPYHGTKTSYGGIPGVEPAGLASGAGSVWVVLQNGTAYQVTP